MTFSHHQPSRKFVSIFFFLNFEISGNCKPGRQAIVAVPMYNALIISDTPLTGVSVFSDTCHREFQERHGELPPELLAFIQGEDFL